MLIVFHDLHIIKHSLLGAFLFAKLLERKVREKKTTKKRKKANEFF